MRWVVCCCLVSLFALSGWAAESKPWPIDVAGFQAVKAKEHPRLFFRRSDLPATRERVRTAEGKQIVSIQEGTNVLSKQGN